MGVVVEVDVEVLEEEAKRKKLIRDRQGRHGRKRFSQVEAVDEEPPLALLLAVFVTVTVAVTVSAVTVEAKGGEG